MAVMRALAIIALVLVSGCREKSAPPLPAVVDLRALPSPVLEVPVAKPAGAELERGLRPSPVEPVIERPPPMGAEALRERGLQARPTGIDPAPLQPPPPMGAEARRLAERGSP